MKVYGFVPAKGTSERIDNKNMKFLDGERLYVRALKTLLKCKEIDKVFLDTESTQMYELANYLDIEFMKRDSNLANNKTDGHKMFTNEIVNYPDADIYVQLLCTSPFIKPETIDNAIRILKNSPNYDSAILMQKDKFYFWQNNLPEYDINHIPNSKDLPETIIESMGLYICKKDAALKNNRRFGQNPLFIFGDKEELVDVNTPADFEYAETIAQGIKQKENRKLRLIKHFITSAALSDILDDLEAEFNTKCGGVISNFKCNISNTKLFGRASTLRLRKLMENEDYRGIYDALESYEAVSENSIIVVENEIGDFAYFGDLNARLAIRSGSIGAIINGATRDKQMTTNIGFPVFAKSYNSQDVRRRATLDYFDKPICIENVVIHPNDLIFADEGAVVVIYQEFEKYIIDKVFQTFKVEKDITTDILKEKNIKDLVCTHGNF